MNPAEFVRLVTEVCALALPPGITPDRLLAYAQVEGLNPAAVSPPNRDGSRDYGLMQINEQWLGRFGVTKEQVMEPCTNLRIGVTILADADRQAACIWNTGRPYCRNGYDQKIRAASARLAAARQASAITPPPPAAAAPAAAPVIPSLGRGMAGRDFTYLPTP